MTAKKLRCVFAHYFAWFSNPENSSEWHHWEWNGEGTRHSPVNFTAPGRRDIATVQYPLLGPYDSSSDDIIRSHVRQAGGALIDAFCVDWYGPASQMSHERDKIIDMNFRKILKVSRTESFSACICYEEKILTHAKLPDNTAACIDTGRRHFKYIADNYFPDPAYWRINGRPVIVIWGNHSLSADAWRAILEPVKPFRPMVLYSYHFPLQNSLLESSGLIDGFYPWMEIKDVEGQRSDLEKYYSIAQDSVKAGRSKHLCAGVWPGFNDSGVSGWGRGARIIHDPHDKVYDLTWELALRHNPEIVSIATWNDWNEGSVIEPSVEQGTGRLDQTREFIRRFKQMNRTARRNSRAVNAARS